MSNLVAVDGIPVERLSEICRAEQEGRLMVLPCKVGDEIYWRGKKHKRLKNILEAEITEITVNAAGFTIVGEKDDGVKFYFHSQDIGEKFYLSYQEAEQALKTEKTALCIGVHKGGKEKIFTYSIVKNLRNVKGDYL